jgi:RNA polymerase sigma-70 factor, ECF subfamily
MQASAGGSAVRENRFRPPFVWTATMQPLALARPGSQLERTLETTGGDAARDRFLRQADRGLDRAYRLAGLLTGSRADAEDAVQDALLRAWRNLGSLRDPAGFDPWFDRILVNVCRDRLRRGAKVRFIELDSDAFARAVPDPFREVLDRDEVLAALAVLDIDERTVVVLHYWADLPLTAVAERTGWPVGTVKSRLHRALGKIGAAVGPRDGDEP